MVVCVDRIIKYASFWEARTQEIKLGEGCPVAPWKEHGIWRQAVLSSDLSSAPFSCVLALGESHAAAFADSGE